MSHDEYKERSRRVWSTGDYRPTSRQLEPASIALVESLEVAAGHHVADIAAGDGNCAIAAAARGATVHATDLSPAMIESGRARSQDLGLTVRWHEADAADLPFEDDSFDRVTSVFGAIFAAEQEVVASEVVRVTQPGGRVGLTAWTPDGYTARLLQIARSHAPPAAPDAPDPLRWGRGDEVVDMFTALRCTVDVRSRVVTFRYPSLDDCLAAFEAHGSAVVARQTMPPSSYAAMIDDIRALISERDRAKGDEVVYDADYLEILVTKP